MDILDLFYTTNYKISEVENILKENIVNCNCRKGKLILIKSKFGHKSWAECNSENCNFWIPLSNEGVKEFRYFPFKEEKTLQNPSLG